MAELLFGFRKYPYQSNRRSLEILRCGGFEGQGVLQKIFHGIEDVQQQTLLICFNDSKCIYP